MNIGPGTRIRYFRGNEYVVVLVAMNFVTRETVVVFSKPAEDPSKPAELLWALSVQMMFYESVNHDGKEVSRFTILG